jgi:hypothetical protein
MKNRLLAATLLSLATFVGAPTPLVMADYPKPSLYPITWELKFSHQAPKRIVVNVPGQIEPQAYWYMPYTIQNDSKQELTFLPNFQMLLPNGQTIRSDKSIPPAVFDAIKQREGNSLLQNALQIAGVIRVGPDEAKDGVAIWPEPQGRLGNFAIFVQGLSGENVKIDGPDKKPVILRKTLQLNYVIRGDEIYPGEDKVNENPQEWIMR